MNIIELGGKVVDGVRVGRGNAGDTAVGSAFAYLFRREFPDSKIKFMQSRKIYTIEDINEINKADLLVLAGGGLFLYDTFPNADVADWQWGISAELVEKIQIPIVVYALGYNKFRGQREFNRNFDRSVSKLVEKSIFFSLRNSGSCRALRKHVKNELRDKIQLNFCPTLLLNRELKFEHKPSKKVGFIIGGDRVYNRHPNLDEYVKQMKKFVNYIKQEGYETVLINHLHDYWLARYVEFDRFIDLFDKPVETIYETFSEIDTVIADRGHGQMIPFAVGCKVISPVSHDKLNWFLEDIEMEEFGVDEGDDELFEKLKERFEKIQSLNWKEFHQKRMDKIMSTNDVNLKLIKQYLEKQ
jgi:polysaccharide pyruvyl transferase WcaK-like protein